jgi:beta-glucosidase-like glycosyl hydrolase
MIPDAATLSLRDAAAQCVFARLGSNLPPKTTAQEDADRVADLLSRTPVGGLLLFRANRASVARVLGRLQDEAPIPLLVASDIERGVGQQVVGGTLFPHAMAVGQTTDPPAAAAQLAQVTAREARACGIHWALAPVADVHVEPANPIINIRAFGTEPGAVSRCADAYVRSAQTAGLLTTAKHFPGHGRTTSDSHATLPVVEAGRDALEAVDLAPFRAAIRAGTVGVMTAHVAYPDLDPSGNPATASSPILTDLLRGTMGFDGVVVSDSLQMEGISAGADDGGPPDAGRQAARLLRAGVDLLLDPGDPERVVTGLVDAVRRGDLEDDRVREACGRVLALKRRFRKMRGDSAFRPSPDPSPEKEQDPDAVVGAAAHRAEAAATARDALSADDAARAWREQLPPRGEGVVVQILPAATGKEAATRLVEALRSALPQAQMHVIPPDAGVETVRAAEADARAGTARLIVSIAEPAAWTEFGLSDSQHALIEQEGQTPTTLAAALGSPAVMDRVSDTGRLHTYSTVPASWTAFVEWIQHR